MTTHMANQVPFSVFDSGGERIGYACTCTCGLGIYQAGKLDAKDRCWELLANHMVAANPELLRIAERLSNAND